MHLAHLPCLLLSRRINALLERNCQSSIAIIVRSSMLCYSAMLTSSWWFVLIKKRASRWSRLTNNAPAAETRARKKRRHGQVMFQTNKYSKSQVSILLKTIIVVSLSLSLILSHSILACTLREMRDEREIKKNHIKITKN